MEGGPHYQEVINLFRRNRQLASRKGLDREGDQVTVKDIYKVREGSYSQSRQPVLASSRRTLNTSQLRELS